MYDTALLQETTPDCALAVYDEMLTSFVTGTPACNGRVRQPAASTPKAQALTTRSDDIATISTACDALALRLVAYGTGASLQGWLHAVLDSVCIDASALQALGGFGLCAHGSAPVQPLRPSAGRPSASDFEWAMRTENRERLWQARHHGHFAAIALREADGRPRAAPLYALILIDPGNPKELRRAGLLAQRLGEQAIAYSGAGEQKIPAGGLNSLF